MSIFATLASDFILSPHNTAMANDSFSFRFLWRILHVHILVYWVIVGTRMLYEYNNLLKMREIQAAELKGLLSEARLDTLTSQMHPHFLFNALNTISAHVERDPRGRLSYAGTIG